MPRRLDVLAALAEIPRHPARSRSLHRSARSAAAAALFDLVLAQDAIPAASRSRSMPCATRSTSARASASPRPSSPAASSRATRSGSMCRRRSTSRCRPIRTMPIIMIGPGTGVAPFRAFLQERMATKAPGRNWLFFGHQRSDYDFFYEDELAGHAQGGPCSPACRSPGRATATRKSTCRTACARTAAICGPGSSDGAHIYVCGDAKRMAKDVERALIDIVAEHGKRSRRRCRALCRRTEKE